jgi:hypothetical protein
VLPSNSYADNQAEYDVLPKNLVLYTEPQLGSTAVHMRGVNNQLHLARLAEMSYVNFSTLEYIVFSVNSRIMKTIAMLR